MTKTYCFVAAKSAGHILPALALATQLKQEDPATRITFVSTNTSLDKKLLYTNEIANKHVPLSLTNIPYRKPWRLPLFGFQLISSCIKSFHLLLQEKPKRIISTGGLIALPVCVTGWLQGIPIDLYELNAEPGSTITWLSTLATTVYYCFDQTAPHLPEHKRQKTEYPLFVSLDAAPKLHNELGLDPKKKTLFILGGSQGSRYISNVIKKLLAQEHKLASHINIIHQLGNNDLLMTWREWYAQHDIPAYVFGYEPTCVPYYKLTDIVICRSGSGTLHELAALQKKCITIPLETRSTHHQVANALAMQAKYPNMVTVVRQQNISLLAQNIVKNLP